MFSENLILYKGRSNAGSLSLLSRTTMVIRAVPDSTGSPPSQAVRMSWCSDCCSRSKGCSSTSSGKSLPSFTFFTLSEKWGLGLSR
uniref:Uncharacterized protein n=1 Tax=Podarcis muralis TaxID=64176 RepID=A0A670IJR1_PODMU